MKRLIVPLLALTAVGFSPATDDREIARRSSYISYLGCAITDSQAVDKNLFDNLVALPLCAKDSNMNYCKVQSFEVTYAERGLYQDSTGLPIVVTDYTQFTCKGDTIPKNWVDVFRQRSYRGDTIFFDKIIAKSPDQKMRLCRGLKMVIK
jgi:hypothetical protein